MTEWIVNLQTDSASDPCPYIREECPVEFTCPVAQSAEGHLTFDGYYYVEDHAPPYPEDNSLEPWERPTRRDQWLPKLLVIHAIRKEKLPYKEISYSNNKPIYNFVELIHKDSREEDAAFRAQEEPADATALKNTSYGSDGARCRYYKVLETHFYKVEVYRREVLSCTDQISEEVDDDGTPMRVCFFPTNLQRLHFRVLEDLNGPKN